MTLDDLKAYDPESYGPRYRCPLCEDKDRDLSVADDGYWRCWHCGRRGRLGGDIEIGEALPHLAERRMDWLWTWNRAKEIPKGSLWRGITNWDGCRWSRRPAVSVIFPFRDWSFQVTGCQRRYRNPPTALKCMTIPGSQLGLFVPSVWTLRSDPVILTEGPMDALSLTQMGKPAMATFGTNLPPWINRVTWNKRVLIATDADEAGDEAAERWRSSLMCRGVVRMRPQVGKDWNEWLQQDRTSLADFISRLEF